MTDKFSEQRNFHHGRRDTLRRRMAAEQGTPKLILITGNSFIQASADRAYPFEQDSNFFYLSGITEPEVVLVIDKDDEYLIVPERDKVRVAFEGLIDTEHMARVSGVETILPAGEGWQRLGKRLKKLKKVATLTPPEPYIPHYEMFTNPSRQRLINRMREEKETLEMHDIRPLLTEMRMMKTSYELKLIQRAITETHKLFAAIEVMRASARYEQELLAGITQLTVKRQLTNAYDPIIASGRNAITLHYSKNNSRLDRKGMLLLDIGLKYMGYSADITRTVSFKPTRRQQAVFNAVLAVQAYATGILKPGITIKEYEEQVADFMGGQLQKLGLIKTISKEAVREFYPHATSHFLGIDVHDAGDYKKPLQAGMVLTVEPGIYIKKESIGIRLEDDVVITGSGCKVLSDALPKSISSLTIQP